MARRRHARGLSQAKHAARAASRNHAASPVSAATAKTPTPELRPGLEAFEQGDYVQAIQAWKRAQQGGARARVAVALAEAHFRCALGAANEVRRIRELSEALELAPDRALYYFHLGLAYGRHGQLRRAIAALEAACRLDPENGRFQRHLALAILTDPVVRPDGFAFLERVSMADEAALRLHVVAMLRQDKPTSAAEVFSNSNSALTEPSAVARLSLGIAELAAGRPNQALSHLEELANGAHINNELRYAAAIGSTLAQLQRGNAPAAFDQLRQLSPPADPRLRVALAATARQVVQALVLDERIEEALLACPLALAAESDTSALISELLAHLHEVLGTRAAQRGDFAMAAEHWEAAFAADSPNPRILRNLALAEEKLERWKVACDYWEALAHGWKKELRTLVGDGNKAELRLRLGLVYRRLAACFEAAGDVHAAVRSLESAFHFDASQLDLQLRAAELYLDAENYAKAIDHLRRALAVHPDDTRVLATLGTAYSRKGDDRQAEAHLNKVLALEPGHPAARAGLAEVHHERGHRWLHGGEAERAADEFWKAMDLDRSTDEHVICLGKAYLELGWLQAAQKAFDVGLTLSPDPVGTRLRIGCAYLDGGYEPEAERAFRQALRITRAPSARVEIGHAYMQRGRSEAANHQFKLVLKSRDPRANAAIGRLFIDAGQEKEAVPYLERAVALDALDAGTYLDLAYAVAVGQQDFGRASAELANAERAASLSGEDDLLPEIESARSLLNKLTAPSPQPSGRGRGKMGRW